MKNSRNLSISCSLLIYLFIHCEMYLLVPSVCALVRSLLLSFVRSCACSLALPRLFAPFVVRSLVRTNTLFCLSAHLFIE